MKKMRVAIIGTGYLGRTVVENFKNLGVDVIHTYNTQKYFADSIKFDLFSKNLDEIIPLDKIDVVIFTSAIEDSSDTEAVLEAMQHAFSVCKNKRVVYISSDAVFDGRKGQYTEIDSPTPLTTYGKNKKLCEDVLRETVHDFCIVRPSYIYGFSLGKLDNRLYKIQILSQSGQSVKKFIDMFKSPTEVNQLTEIITTVCRSDFKGVLHACGKRSSVYEFFKQALAVLTKKTISLEPDRIPENAPPEYLHDTSLDSTLLKNKFGFEPISIEAALSDSKKIKNL